MKTPTPYWMRRMILASVLLFFCVSSVTVVMNWDAIASFCGHLLGIGILPMALGSVFLTAALLAVASFGTALFREIHAEQAWRRWRGDQTVRSSELGVVIVTSSSYFVFTKGLLKPTTFLSTRFLVLSSPEETRAVLAHEALHRSRHDPLRMLAWRVLARTFFFLPIVGVLEEHALTDRECAADVAALEAGSTRVDLLDAVARAIKHHGTLRPVLVAPFAAHPDLLERCRVLTGERPIRVVPAMRIAVTAAVLGVGFLAALAMPRPTSAFAQAGICAQSQQQSIPAWLQRQSVAPAPPATVIFLINQ